MDIKVKGLHSDASKDPQITSIFYAPAMAMAGAFSICLYICMSHQQHRLSKKNSFDLNFIKLGHIVKYHNVFFKFHNGLYEGHPKCSDNGPIKQNLFL